MRFGLGSEVAAHLRNFCFGQNTGHVTRIYEPAGCHTTPGKKLAFHDKVCTRRASLYLMPDSNTAEQELSNRKELILQKLRDSGGYAGNTHLMRALTLSPDKYWPTRNKLIDEGRITRGKGRGGSISLVESSAAPVVPPAVPATPDLYQTEDSLYDALAKVIREEWTRDYRFRETIVEVTARQGRRDTGGAWTRPDITVVGMTTYLFVPGRHFDVTTFEVKKRDGLDVTAVYEALAHRRASTRSYAIFHTPGLKETGDPRDKVIEAICAEAKKHGIGVILADDPTSYESWDERLEAARILPNPEDLNDFIALQLTAATKDEIVHWFK